MDLLYLRQFRLDARRAISVKLVQIPTFVGMALAGRAQVEVVALAMACEVMKPMKGVMEMQRCEMDEEGAAEALKEGLLGEAEAWGVVVVAKGCRWVVC